MVGKAPKKMLSQSSPFYLTEHILDSNEKGVSILQGMGCEG